MTQDNRFAVLTCAVVEDELRHLAADMDHIVHFEVMDYGLHSDPNELRTTVQQRVAELEARDDLDLTAIVLGYGLCSRGNEGITPARVPLVITRAHDCITLLMGSKEKYEQYTQQHPGAYFYSVGWNRNHTPPGKERYDQCYQKYVQQYGQDNAEYLMELEQGWMQQYNRATFVDLGIGQTDQDRSYTQQCADWLNWDYDQVKGDPELLRDLLAGRWDDGRFVVVKPGQTLRFTGCKQIIEAAPVSEGSPASDGSGGAV